MDRKQTILPTASDTRFYQENGYWISPKLLTDNQVEVVRHHYYKVLAGEYETGVPPLKRNLEPADVSRGVVKITNCYQVDATLSRLVLHPLIGEIAARLVGCKAIRLWRDHLWYKPSESGVTGSIGWHQDYPYWQCAEPAELITAWIALDDVDENNGCMEVIPGSHKWGLLGEGDLYSHDMEGLQRRIEGASGHPFETVPLVLPAGAVSFHHCLIVHGSRPNRSNRPRISIAPSLIPEGTRYRAGSPVDSFSNVKLLSGKDGDLFAGPSFPIVYREDHMANPWQVDN